MNFQGVVRSPPFRACSNTGNPQYRCAWTNIPTRILLTDYSIESNTSTDYRKTLYWNPYFSLQSGQSALITFYTSDIKGIYHGLAEGTDEDGNPVNAEFSFIVE
jgi:hypothetical protein